MKLSSRTAFVLGATTCALLLGFGFYLQYVEMQDPCPLCMVQRVAFVVLGVVLLIAALHGPARRGIIVYGLLALLVAALGAAVAARHVWLQHLPKNLVPACGPGLEYMLKQFPLGDVLTRVLMGSGECAEAGWTFLGLTIAGWSLLWFVLLGIGAAWTVLDAWRRR